MEILVLYNQVEASAVGRSDDLAADDDTVKTAREITDTLKNLGHGVSEYAIKSQDDLIRLPNNVDVIFNNAFGIGGRPNTEHEVALALERLGLPYTGAGAAALFFTNDKARTGQWLKKHGVPVPDFTVSHDGKFVPGPQYPLIIKPGGTHSSLGIDQGSVVTNEKSARQRVREIFDLYGAYGPVLIQHFVEGRELNVAVLGNGNYLEALPISEIRFEKDYPGEYKIVGFSEKWRTGSLEDKTTVGVCPAVNLSLEIETRMINLAKEVFILAGCQGLARVDFRLDNNGVPYVLEVNPNPGIGPNDGATRSARARGWSYEQFLMRLVDIAKEGRNELKLRHAADNKAAKTLLG